MRHLFGACAFVALAAAYSSTAFAQETTASIRGVVSDGGQPVAGAQLKIEHTESGTVANVQSDAEGNFVAAGLRPGGPYTVRVMANGLETLAAADIYLTVGQPMRVPVELATVEELVITASRRKDPTQLSSGPLSLYDQQAIAGVASVKRDIRDIAKRDPMATINPVTNGISIAGSNARNNRFSVDGQRFNDTLGLNDGGLPTSRGPIPLDAIEQMTVKVAPSDITEGDMQGGAINVVLKSGTNRFRGSAFYTYAGDSLTGDETRGTKVTTKFTSQNYGASISGPIIQDKLFFALTYEHLTQFTPATTGLAGFGNVVPNLSQAQIDNFGTVLQSVYSYDSLGVYPGFDETDDKYVAKLDWNITDKHRLGFTFIRNENTQKSAGGGVTSVTTPSLLLASNVSVIPQTVDSYIAQLNSDWSGGVQTELRANYRRYLAPKNPNGEKGFAQFTTCLDLISASNPINCVSGTPGVPDNASLVAGTLSSIQVGNSSGLQANTNFITNYGLDGILRIERGSHSLKLNASYNRNEIGNFFVPNSLGVYYFDSLADLQARRASSVTLQGSITGDLYDATGDFAYDQLTVGIQDSWDIRPDLNFTFGVRGDIFLATDQPKLNTAFVGRYGFENTATYDGRGVIQPRFGLTWRPIDRLVIRAAGGLFAGGTPDIFMGRSFTDTGVVNNSITIQRLAGGGCNVAAPLCAAALDNVDGRTFDPAVTNYLSTNIASIANASTTSLDPQFDITSSWKASLSADYTLDLTSLHMGDGWRIGADVLIGQVNSQSYYVDLRAQQIGVLPDGRPRYSSAVVNNDLQLTNTDKGRSFTAVARFQKRWTSGFDTGASYTFSDVKEFTSMGGTIASDNYGNSATFDTNSSLYGRSAYEIRHNLKLNVDYAHAFFSDYSTRLSLWGEYRSGLPYSLTMRDQGTLNNRSVVFGTVGSATRALLYVPDLTSNGSDPRVVFDSAATFNALKDFVEARGLQQGAVVGKNTERAPEVFKIDLHAEQELPIPLVSGARFKLFGDVENLLNLINKDWGSYRTIASNTPVISVACVAGVGNACAQYRYSAFNAPVEVNQARLSVWGVRVGAKVEF